MKSLAELEAIRQKTLERINLRRENENELVRIVVGMATCGIAAGARPVMLAFMEEVNKREMGNVTVTQTGCVGMCRLEPMVDVYLPGQPKVTYVHMTPEKAVRVMEEHIAGGHPVAEYTIGAAEK
ncbi:MAG: (2Fe-2S) ferredoxin domain-containing protein [Clostridiales bacterium]|nr:(2Fe-2S) ferredoxin domain-containing protein [Clostridiales bacterium]